MASKIKKKISKRQSKSDKEPTQKVNIQAQAALTMLSTLIEKNPYSRIGQLIENAIMIERSKNPEFSKAALFYLDDASLLEALSKFEG